MDDTFGARVKRTAEEVAQRMGEAAQQASERLGEMRDVARLNQQIRTLQREKDRCRQTIADLVVRMFDQDAFVTALLQPEYQRIKEIDVEIARLEEERELVGQEQPQRQEAMGEPAAEQPEHPDTFPCEE